MISWSALCPSWNGCIWIFFWWCFWTARSFLELPSVWGSLLTLLFLFFWMLFPLLWRKEGGGMAEEEFWYLSAMRTRSDSFLAQASLHHPVGKAANTGTKLMLLYPQLLFTCFLIACGCKSCTWFDFISQLWNTERVTLSFKHLYIHLKVM